VAGTVVGGVTSFFLITLRFAVVFLAFLEDFFTFFFAICLLEDTATYIPSKRHAERKKWEERRRHGKGINNPDFVDLVEFLKTFKYDPKLRTKLESPSSYHS
jgi:hypothetical protein